MERELVTVVLRGYEPDLRRRGLVHAALFVAVACDDAKIYGKRLGRKPKLTPRQTRETGQRLVAGGMRRGMACGYEASV
jgi:hypothetical protein